eukprot:scaffold394660_cov12-Prasinocladus_malaysianus.AAC.1
MVTTPTSKCNAVCLAYRLTSFPHFPRLTSFSSIAFENRSTRNFNGDVDGPMVSGCDHHAYILCLAPQVLTSSPRSLFRVDFKTSSISDLTSQLT